MQHGLEEAWRAHIVHPEAIQCGIEGDEAELSFRLPPGAYATAVLRELVMYTQET